MESLGKRVLLTSLTSQKFIQADVKVGLFLKTMEQDMHTKLYMFLLKGTGQCAV